MRFLHTADWQLGMTRHFLSADAQARFTDARLEAVRALGRTAVEEGCSFILVCGDVFESNLLSPQVVGRALEALRSIPVPVYLLPGNHDPVDAASIYGSAEFVRRCPENVHVLRQPGIHPVAPGVELVAAPWDSKHPLGDLAGQQCQALSPPGPDGTVRILAAHGAVDTLTPDGGNPALIRLGTLLEALGDGRVRYVALGDRHSLTKVGGHRAIWYPGAPEVTDFDETEPGHVLVVDVDADHVQVTWHCVGTWRFVRKTWPLNSARDVADCSAWLDGQVDKARTVLKLGFEGTVTVRDKAELDDLLDRFMPLFAAIQFWGRRSDLVVTPDEGDFGDLGLSGFAASALEELKETAAESGRTDAAAAQNALGLLYRLAGSAQ
jgi:DNA repair exonuclease SbcCD nuclease subunit